MSSPDGACPDVPMNLRPLHELENDLYLTASPSRLYSDAFWRSLPWSRVAGILGEVVAVELGCGSGSRFGLLSAMPGRSLVQYVGIDIQPRDTWDDLRRCDERVEFLQTPVESLPGDLLSSANLIVSQSVLEHVKEDLMFFLAHQACLSPERAVIQIHLVPAAASLFLYLFQGYRQYPRRTLGRIAAIYPGGKCSLFPLGGMRSNVLHFFAITLPGLMHVPSLRQIRSNWYASLLRLCYRSERTLNSGCPSFYAIILEHQLKQPLFA